LDDLKNVGESNYNPGDGTDQRVQSLVFMMMMTFAEYTTSAGYFTQKDALKPITQWPQ